MERLSYAELILLDNLIYLEWEAKENKSIKEIVDDILKDADFDKLMGNIGNCTIKTPKYQWIKILNYIRENNNLCNYRIKNIAAYKNGMKFACLVNENNNAVVIFRGTSTEAEWEDNGEGAYTSVTNEQFEALKFINNLNYDNITVSGHSKGGNKAQYVTILSSKIKKCVSVNGQGFSNSFLESYREEINKNKSKIVCINAEYDYVSCLFNTISGENHFIKTDFQVNPFDYHRANILLDNNGKLRQETSESVIFNIVNGFSLYIISNLNENLERTIADKVIDIIELFLCKKDEKNIMTFAGEYLIMDYYRSKYEQDEDFIKSYALVEILILPLVFWDEFIYIEETKSEAHIKAVTENIRWFCNKIVNKVQNFDESQKYIVVWVMKGINDFIYRLEREIL
ncbi:Mbeg1-like protein [Clostridium saccharoperbutylacetonicum]